MRHFLLPSLFASTLLFACTHATQHIEGGSGGQGGEAGSGSGGDSLFFCTEADNTCADGHAKACNRDGTAFDEYECDSFQGMQCDPDGCKGACIPNAIGTSYIGCEYWPTVTPNPVWPGFDFAVAVANTTAEPATVTVHLGDALAATREIAPGALAAIVLPWQMDLKGPEPTADSDTGPSKVVSAGAYRLRSTQPVTVSQFSPLQYVKPYTPTCPHAPIPDLPGCFSFQNDASLLLPTNALGEDYQTLSYSTLPSWPLLRFQAGFIAITATADDTEVRLAPASTDPIFAAGAPIDTHGQGTVMLQRGDVLSVHSARLPNDMGENPGPDLSGTRVIASHPVQVIGGVACTNVPANAEYCDHLEETMPPTQALGTDYLVAAPGAPGSSATSPHTIRVQAIFPGTTITFDPPILPPTPLEPTDPPLEINDVLADVRITGSSAILVGQYMQGSTSVPSHLGDPSLSIAVSTEQFRNDYIFLAPADYEESFVNIIAPVGATVTLDSSPVPADAFTPVGSSGYAVARVHLPDTEVHHLASPSDFGIQVYGYGYDTSYMIQGGLDLVPITVPPVL